MVMRINEQTSSTSTSDGSRQHHLAVDCGTTKRWAKDHISIHLSYYNSVAFRKFHDVAGTKRMTDLNRYAIVLN